MEPEAAASRRAQLVRMDQDRISQTSSVATISYFPSKTESDGKVQAFGKRCHAARRDPNCPVVIRGWLNKKDSSGLKLWKRRWFVLSNYCLFYYKDSREESVLGSIPLPSYKILFCTPRECKNRKFTFKVVHQGMRSYFFSADTQEDMLGWVRALSQSAAMEPDSSLNRRCSSYQDFTQMGGSSESVDFPNSPSDGEDPPQNQNYRQVGRALSEPGHLAGGRVGATHRDPRGRGDVRQRSSSPPDRTPSPCEFSRRRTFSQEDDPLAYVSGRNTPPTQQPDATGAGSVTPRGQLGSRPHTPVGRVDIRPQDDPGVAPQTLYYTPASPKLEFKSTPNTPVTERWPNMNKPIPTYGSVHHIPTGRRPLGKSFSSGAQADLLPPLPPSSRAPPHPPHHHHHHHHHRSHLSVCLLPPAPSPKPELRETPPIRPLESDADAVLTRLCGCDKLLQSLSLELAQLQVDKDSVQCALEVSRLQLEDWTSQGPRAQDEALTQKALLQEELVTIRARMCDVSMEMERVWSQYERMESELSVIRSQLQHICNFGIPQEQSQAQRELWMMEDILAGLKVNRDHFRLLLGLQRHHMYQQAAPHPGSPGSPSERMQGGPPMDMDQEPPVRPPLPQDLQEQSPPWTESPYEAIYSHAVDPVHRRGNNQPDLLNVKAQKDTSESRSGSKWITPDASSQSSKKMKMSEEEQLERMKRNQERASGRKKPPLPAAAGQSGQSSDPREEPPFPLRVTRVVTAVLPSSLVARRVSVEDPPPELHSPLPEQIPPEVQQRLAEQGRRMLSKPPRRLQPEDPPVKGCVRQQHQNQRASRTPSREPPVQDRAGAGGGSVSVDARAEEPPPTLLTPPVDPDPCLTPQQREAKLRRVERIRERVIRSAVRENAAASNQLPDRGEGRGPPQVTRDTAGKQRATSDHSGGGGGRSLRSPQRSAPAELGPPGGLSQEDDDQRRRGETQEKFGNKTQHKARGGRTGVTRAKTKRSASPYHVSSVTVYQTDGGGGFTALRGGETPEVGDGDDDAEFPSSDLRAKWFLSTNQWQGVIPLQVPGIEEASDSGANGSEPVTAMSAAVSQSLEKMKENHSLFYKIACDISISDTDITRSDGASRPREDGGGGEELMITESTGGVVHDSEDADVGENSRTVDRNVGEIDEAALHTSASPEERSTLEEIPRNGREEEEESGQVEASEQERSGETKRSRSLCDEDGAAVLERGDASGSSPQEGARVARSASFGKTRVTVIRTSL